MTARSVRWLLLLALALTGGLLGGCVLSPPGQEALRTARLLPAFFSSLPVMPEAWGRPEPVATVLPIPSAAGAASLHIYRPPEGRHPALILSLGVDPAPPDDPRVVRLLGGLARAGVVAVLVQSEALDGDRITPDAPDLLVRAFLQLEADPAVRADRIGFVGFSVGAGLASVAAADPRIQDRVRLLVAFGGYFSLEDMALAITTSTLREDSALTPWQPDELPRAVIRTNLAGAVTDPAAREGLALALDSGDAAAGEELTGHARAVYDLLRNTDPLTAPALYAQLPEGQRAEFEAVSPASYVSELRASIYLMHDRGDPYIPYVETRRFRRALERAGRPPYAQEFDIFQHVDLTRGGSPRIVARDLVKLFLEVNAILKRLGHAAPP